MRKNICPLMLVLVAALHSPVDVFSQPVVSRDKQDIEWFDDAKLGIFIHYGIYSAGGIKESWSFYQGKVPYKDYMALQKKFDAAKYDPEEWAKLFRKAGARYAVLTTKHHDGFALWDTDYSDLDIMNSPARRDLVGPFCAALRRNDLKVGLYFSHLDWSHPDYASVRNKGDEEKPGLNPFSYPAVGKSNPAAWNRFIRFHRGQLKELGTKYKPDLFWFDGDWERGEELWNMRSLRDSLLAWSPGVVLNSRMKGYGDYLTPERGMPVVSPPGRWEFCMTMNDSWSYVPEDTNYKSSYFIIRTFAEVIGLGGNLLLNVGPKGDGSIGAEESERLLALGRWCEKHGEAIYGTRAGLPFGHFYGPTALSKDRKTLFLFLLDPPRDKVYVKGIRNKIRQVRVVGTRETGLHYAANGAVPWLKIPGTLIIDFPRRSADPDVTVLALDLEGELDLYHGVGGIIEEN